MSKERLRKNKIALGDFQTPTWFAHEVCGFLGQDIRPRSVLEPTCGLGNFLIAALDTFETIESGIGVEIKPDYVQAVQERLANHVNGNKIEVYHTNFLTTDWSLLWNQVPEPLLIIGNPPWVTNAQLGKLASQNLPPKSNFKEQPGLVALMGSSNFDISEWMLLKLIELLQQRNGLLAMLCKTAVIRRVLQEVWQNSTAPGTFHLYRFDAQAVFNASVDACLFVYQPGSTFSFTCPIYQGLSSDNLLTEIGYRNGQLVANAAYYDRWQHLQKPKGQPTRYQWRSGIKHDCAPVMELHKEGRCYVNKLGGRYELEAKYLYPLWKSSDVANGEAKRPFRWLLVPQRSVGESTLPIQRTAPKTWQYLQDHAPYFDRRKSRIYQNRPRFSIFGVGSYTFAPWKVAISGLYKKLEFVVIEPKNHSPVVLDDTCYFLAAESQEEAVLLADLLNSQPAREFLGAFIFWEAKRPITATILNQLDIEAVAREIGQERQWAAIKQANYPQQATQLRLLEERSEYCDSHSDC